MALFGVIVPVYNRTQYLAQCLASIPADLNGSVLLANDSTDPNVEAVLERLVGYDPSTDLFPRRAPGGLGWAKTVNEAIVDSDTSFIHILHDDDWVEPGFYTAAEEAIRPGVDVWSCGYQIQDNQGFTKKHFLSTSGQDIFDHDWHKGNTWQVGAIVVRRSTLIQHGLFRPDLPYTADWEMWVRLRQAGLAWVHNPCPLFNYRVHPGNASAQMPEAFKEAEVEKTRRLFQVLYGGKRETAMRDNLKAIYAPPPGNMAWATDSGHGGGGGGGELELLSQGFQSNTAKENVIPMGQHHRKHQFNTQEERIGWYTMTTAFLKQILGLPPEVGIHGVEVSEDGGDWRFLIDWARLPKTTPGETIPRVAGVYLPVALTPPPGSIATTAYALTDAVWQRHTDQEPQPLGADLQVAPTANNTIDLTDLLSNANDPIIAIPPPQTLAGLLASNPGSQPPPDPADPDLWDALEKQIPPGTAPVGIVFGDAIGEGGACHDSFNHLAVRGVVPAADMAIGSPLHQAFLADGKRRFGMSTHVSLRYVQAPSIALEVQ